MKVFVNLMLFPFKLAFWCVLFPFKVILALFGIDAAKSARKRFK